MTDQYELLYIIPGSFSDEDVPGVKTKVSQIVTGNGATITREEDRGRQKLAYKIGAHTQGVYALVEFDADTAKVAAIQNQLQLAQEVLRFMIIDRVVEAEEIITARAKLRESIQAKRQEKVAKEVGRAMAKAQEQRVTALKQEEAKVAKKAPTESIDKELDKLLSDDVKV